MTGLLLWLVTSAFASESCEAEGVVCGAPPVVTSEQLAPVRVETVVAAVRTALEGPLLCSPTNPACLTFVRPALLRAPLPGSRPADGIVRVERVYPTSPPAFWTERRHVRRRR